MELGRIVSFDMICVLKHIILVYGAVHVHAKEICVMAFAIPKIVGVVQTWHNIRPVGTISNYHHLIGPSRLYSRASNVWTASSDHWNDEISQSVESSEFAKEEASSIWVDSPTPTTAEDVPVPSTVQKRRRVRYTGTYPKQFIEKYKELNGDFTTIQKVLQKGMTPAGQHIPIMIDECMEYLGFNLAATTNGNHNYNISTYVQTNQCNTFFVDCTLGYGGHSTRVLQHLLMLTSQQPESNHQMLCFDRDPIEIVKATDRLQKVITDFTEKLEESDTMYHPANEMVKTVNKNFCELRTHLEANNGVGKVTALLADLGLSSMQIDDASRGFTYKYDGPLDMRMNVHSANNNTNITTESAYDLLQRWTVPALTKIIQENSDEVFAPIIAQAIVGNKDRIPSTTLELANVVREVIRPYLLKSGTSNKSDQRTSKNNRQTTIENTRHYDSVTIKKQLDSTVARVMQAIRIEVNAEFDSLQRLLDDLPNILSPNGGRAVILTFHSGEDRRVKKAFKQGFKDGIYSSWSRDVVRPTSEERYNNPRSSCCKLRWVIRSDKNI